MQSYELSATEHELLDRALATCIGDRPRIPPLSLAEKDVLRDLQERLANSDTVIIGTVEDDPY